MIWLRRVLFVSSLAFLILTFVNASWLTHDAPGRPLLIANGGIAQDYRPGGRGEACPARAILPPIHFILEDTLRSVLTAQRMGADLIAIDVARTADDRLVLYPDADLSCRTQASGPVSAHRLADLQKLDAGYGYSADGGQTFPLRGKGVGLIPSLDEVLAANPKAHFLFRFPGNDAAAVPLLAKTLAQAGHEVRGTPDGFVGDAALVAAVEKALPGAWAFTPEAARACTRAYRQTGWTGFLPSACGGATMLAPLDGAFTLWGWPNRVQQRIEAGGGHVLALASMEGASLEGAGADGLGQGLRHARELTDVPTAFHGTVLVDNYWTVGPALRPSLDARTNAEALAAQDRDENTP